MAKPEKMLRDFLTAARPYHGDGPPPELWLRLIREEVNELADALAGNDHLAIADACADILYNVYGVAVTRQIPIGAVLAEVHRSNMTKLLPPVSVRADGKIIKGPHFEPPRIGPLLRCPLCCEHGILLTRECGWCRNDDGEPYEGPRKGEPQWLCRHGIGAEPDDRDGDDHA